MDRDEITDAFARWKTAHDAFRAMEQRLFGTVSTGLRESDPLLIEVQAKRAHAEELLLAAMKLLHERRHRPDAP